MLNGAFAPAGSDSVSVLGRLTLSARAQATRARADGLGDPDLAGFFDADARDLAARMALPLTQDAAFVRGVVLRSLWFDKVALDVLQDHPQAQAVSLGAGLCTRWRRLKARLASTSQIDWLNVDLPAVIAWRARYMTRFEGETDVSGSALDIDWFDRLGLSPGRPLLVMLEGVCPYLPQAALEQMIAQLTSRLQAQGSQGWLALDFIDPLLLHRPMQVEGITLPVQSGFVGTAQITALHPSLHLVDSAHPFSRFSPGHGQFEAAFIATSKGRHPYTWACIHLGAAA